CLAVFDPGKNLAREIRSRLVEKCQRHYRGVGEIWLVIYAQTVVTESEELDDALRGMQIPASHCFGRIFILHVTVNKRGCRRRKWRAIWGFLFRCFTVGCLHPNALS